MAYRRWRPMVERSIAWLVANNNRRARSAGVKRNQLGRSTWATTVNLRRLANLGPAPRPNRALAQHPRRVTPGYLKRGTPPSRAQPFERPAHTPTIRFHPSLPGLAHKILEPPMWVVQSLLGHPRKA